MSYVKEPWWVPFVVFAFVVLFATVLLPLFIWVVAWTMMYISEHGLPIWNLLPWPPGF